MSMPLFDHDKLTTTNTKDTHFQYLLEPVSKTFSYERLKYICTVACVNKERATLLIARKVLMIHKFENICLPKLGFEHTHVCFHACCRYVFVLLHTQCCP